MTVIPLPGGAVALDPEAVEIVHMMMVAGARQLRVDGMTVPDRVRAVMAVVEAARADNRRLAETMSDPERSILSDASLSPQMVTVSHAADRADRDVRTVARWARSGRLRSAHQSGPGRPWVVDLNEVLEVVGG